MQTLLLLSLGAKPQPPSPPTQSQDIGPLLRGLVGGAAYGLVAAGISHPFDTLKTRAQSGVASSVAAGGVSRIASLYKGIGPAVAASIFFRTVPFIGYEATRSALDAHKLFVSQPLMAAFLGGVVGGAMRGCLETPAELLKTRMQTGGTWSLRSASLLLRGLGSTCLRNACVIGLFWVAFEASREARAVLPPVAANFVGGGGCSVLAWATIYPLDTAKSVIQAGKGSTSVVRTLMRLYGEQGLAGWYKGMGAGLTRAFLANGGGMACYILAQQLLLGSLSSKEEL
jgi:solute carrier family 25 carnitine/acylcarnitine transporter 20/29